MGIEPRSRYFVRSKRSSVVGSREFDDTFYSVLVILYLKTGYKTLVNKQQMKIKTYKKNLRFKNEHRFYLILL